LHFRAKIRPEDWRRIAAEQVVCRLDMRKEFPPIGADDDDVEVRVRIDGE
jgi:hypothetical protein